MSRQKKISLIGTTIVILIILTAGALALIYKFTPSDEVMPLTEYYPLKDKEVLIVMQDSIYEKKGLLENEHVYIDLDTVVNNFNKRFYWDEKEEVLSYTTPNEVITAIPKDLAYYSNGEEKKLDYPIVLKENNGIYLSIDFVEKYSDMEFTYYDDPDRVVIQYKWGDYLFTNVKKATQLRVEPDIKSDILVPLPEGTLLTYVDTSEVTKNHFSKVMTEDGIIGYVKNKHVEESQYITLNSQFKPVEYTHISMDKKVNMVWHQVTNMDANRTLTQMLNKTKGVNVVSPTWFSLADEDGNVTSLADRNYVSTAHDNGVQVWALVDDFNRDVSKEALFTSTKSRTHLISELMKYAKEYNLDGINIDFELVPQTAGEDFIQFIRELSVSCRNNNIVLSIDNYVPASYNAFYDWNEQGQVADYVIIMAYDEHHTNSEVAGSVSSISYVQNAVTEILNYVPKERVIMGIPFYTRLWKEETKEDGSFALSSQAYGMSVAEHILEEQGVTAKWDDSVGQYYGEYKKDGALYKMWLEEDESIKLKLKAISDTDVAGIAAWKLGLEKVDIWDVITEYINK